MNIRWVVLVVLLIPGQIGRNGSDAKNVNISKKRENGLLSFSIAVSSSPQLPGEKELRLG